MGQLVSKSSTGLAHIKTHIHAGFPPLPSTYEALASTPSVASKQKWTGHPIMVLTYNSATLQISAVINKDEL